MYYKKQLQSIQAMIFDVDGVFSNSFVVADSGKLNRIMNAKDGYAIKSAVEQGYLIAIITGGNSQAVKERFQLLGITDIYLSQTNKIDAFTDFYLKYNISPEKILYMGDDMPDFEVMTKVGLATCPADAVSEIKKISNYISDKKGGEGCVRDIVEQVMKIQKKWKNT